MTSWDENVLVEKVVC